MKNKEIEELLNNIKEQLIIDEKLGKEIAKDFHKTTLNYKEIKLLLSYIEQLQNNRDKAIEVIDLITPELWNISNAMTYKLKDIKYILKGDSDEN